MRNITAQAVVLNPSYFDQFTKWVSRGMKKSLANLEKRPVVNFWLFLLARLLFSSSPPICLFVAALVLIVGTTAAITTNSPLFLGQSSAIALGVTIVHLSQMVLSVF